jgi:adenylylsulfate kinase
MSDSPVVRWGPDPTGAVVWITGLPSSGKSTFARAVTEEMSRRGITVCTLDGDEVREALGGAFSYTTQGRAAFYETLARLASLLAKQELVVLVPATAQRRAFRERAKALAPAFVEVWVDTPLEECARRDTKGLYGAQKAGSVSDVPGADAPYEAPGAPDVVAHGGRDARAVAALLVRIGRLRANSGH